MVLYIVHHHLIQSNSGIPPGGNFTYAIPITQKGTYWIHSHYRVSDRCSQIFETRNKDTDRVH